MLPENEDNPDDPHLQEHSALQLALKAIEDVATAINTAVRQQHDRAVVLDIQEKFNDVKLATIDRVFVRSGKLARIQGGSTTEFEFFLFNDLFLYAFKSLKLTGWKYSVKWEAPIDGSLKLDTDLDGDSIFKDPNNAIRFRITTMNDNKSFVVVTKSEEDKAAWCKDIQRCIDGWAASHKEESEAAKAAFAAREAVEPEDNPNSNVCRVCSKPVGILNRKKCKSCLRFVHP